MVVCFHLPPSQTMFSFQDRQHIFSVSDMSTHPWPCFKTCRDLSTQDSCAPKGSLSNLLKLLFQALRASFSIFMVKLCEAVDIQANELKVAATATAASTCLFRAGMHKG